MAVIPVELSLGWGARGIEGVGLSAQAEMARDAANGAWVGDGRDHVPAASAAGAAQDIFTKDGQEKLGPGEIAGGGSSCGAGS